MSIRLHPERNILITGLPGSSVLDTSIEVAKRLRRRYYDLQSDYYRRNTNAMTRFFNNRPGKGNSVLSLMIREYCFRSKGVFALNFPKPLEQDYYGHLRDCCYTVMLDPPMTVLGSPSGTATAASTNGENAAKPSLEKWHKQLVDCDIYVGPTRLSPRAAAKLIVHCFYT